MSMNQTFIAELQIESKATHKMLERVPLDKSDWKPHQKSMKLGNLATHVAELPGWISMVLTTDELDLAKREYKPNIATTTEQLLDIHTGNVKGALEALKNASEDEFGKMWALRNGGHTIFTLPKAAVLRSHALSHMYHHRGQLSVYLRLLDVPVPGMYGPSSDDMAAPAATEAAKN